MTPLPSGLEPPLPAAEERALARAVEAGLFAAHLLRGAGHPSAGHLELTRVVADGHAAAERLLATNLRLVVHLVRVVARTAAVDEEELFQEGFLGLEEALRRFDWAASPRFGTWARHWVLGRVRRAALASRRGSRSSARAMAEVRRRAEELTRAHGREVGLVEAARTLGRDARWVAVHAPPRVVPLVGADGTSLDVAAPEPAEAALEAAVLAQLDGLSTEARAVVTATVLRGWSRRRAARELGMGERRVKELEEAALRRLRRASAEIA